MNETDRPGRSRATTSRSCSTLLPHRYPFLLVDRIVEARGDEYGVGIKNVTVNEPHFQGHFPGRPVMPGVLLIEAMAQTAGALCVASQPTGSAPSVVYLMTIDKAKFRKPVVPGDQVRFHMTRIAKKRNMWWFRGEAKVDGVARLRGGSLRHAGARMTREDPSERGRRGRREPRRRRRDRAVLPCRAAGEARRRRPARLARQPRRRHDDRRAHAHLSLRLDRPSAAGPQIPRRAGPPRRRRGLPDPRGRDDEPGHRGRRRRKRSSARAACSSPTPMSRTTAGIGEGVILSNNVMLAGHVQVGDFAIVSGGAAAHQFVRIGAHAFVGGLAGRRARPHSVRHGARQPRRARRPQFRRPQAARLFARGDPRAPARLQDAVLRGKGTLKERVDDVAEAFPDQEAVQQIVAFLREGGDRAICVPRDGKDEEA